MQFKKPLKSSDQLSHLKKYKNLIVEQEYENEVELYLRGFNYINIITPFKHSFSEKDQNNIPIKHKYHGRLRHIYPEKIHFQQYAKLFHEERSQYLEIMDGLHKFETVFKSLVSYNFLTVFNVRDTRSATNAFKTFQKQLPQLKILKYVRDRDELQERIKHMERNYNRIIDELNGESRQYPYKNGNKVDDIYVYFDRLSLKSIINIFYSLSKNVQNKIYSDLQALECNLETKSLDKFKQRIFNLYPIRNAVMHCNSLEILLRYETPGSNKLRSKENRQQYERTIIALKKLSKKDIFNLT